MVHKHFMGRVQNTFYFAATGLQLVLSILVGTVAHTSGLTLAYLIVGGVYLVGSLATVLPVKETVAAEPLVEKIAAD